MTQVNRAQRATRKVASTQRATGRTVAQLRADYERQVRACIDNDANMALTEPQEVRKRMKELRKRAGSPSQYAVAYELKVPPRTFQSWENAEVETDRENYEKVAAYYAKKLGRAVTANWILFGQDQEPPLPVPVSANGNVPDEAPAWARELLANQADIDEKLTTALEYLASIATRDRRRRATDSGSASEVA